MMRSSNPPFYVVNRTDANVNAVWNQTAWKTARLQDDTNELNLRNNQNRTKSKRNIIHTYTTINQQKRAKAKIENFKKQK